MVKGRWELDRPSRSLEDVEVTTAKGRCARLSILVFDWVTSLPTCIAIGLVGVDRHPVRFAPTDLLEHALF